MLFRSVLACVARAGENAYERGEGEPMHGGIQHAPAREGKRVARGAAPTRDGSPYPQIGTYLFASVRFSALTIALIEASSMLVSTPAP